MKKKKKLIATFHYYQHHQAVTTHTILSNAIITFLKITAKLLKYKVRTLENKRAKN